MPDGSTAKHKVPTAAMAAAVSKILFTIRILKLNVNRLETGNKSEFRILNFEGTGGS